MALASHPDHLPHLSVSTHSSWLSLRQPYSLRQGWSLPVTVLTDVILSPRAEFECLFGEKNQDSLSLQRKTGPNLSRTSAFADIASHCWLVALQFIGPCSLYPVRLPLQLQHLLSLLHHTAETVPAWEPGAWAPVQLGPQVAA